MRVAFIVGEFPVVSEPFIINQVADLRDRGVEVHVYSFRRGDESKASVRFEEYDMRTHLSVLEPPRNIFRRFLSALPRIVYLLLKSPLTLIRVVAVAVREGDIRGLLSLKYVFWTYPFVGSSYDLVHCHFGSIATKYVRIRSMLGDTTPLVTTLYGYDISHIIQQKGKEVYEPLHLVCSRYLVMSDNMRERAIASGFPADCIVVHPVSLDVSEYSRQIPIRDEGEPVRLLTVARLVEKKGIDDLLRALALVKKESKVPFTSTIVGGGPLSNTLHQLASELAIDNVVTFTGPIPFEQVNAYMRESDIYIQPSKTAKDGDME